MLTNIYIDTGTLAVIVSGKICDSRRTKEIQSLFKDYYANFTDLHAQNYSYHTTKQLSMTAPKTLQINPVETSCIYIYLPEFSTTSSYKF